MADNVWPGGTPVPDGYELAWERPTASWEVLIDIEPMGCRYTTGPGRATCRKPSVARLNRGARGARPQWWHYCGDHLFGRRIRDGVLEHQVLRPITDGGAS